MMTAVLARSWFQFVAWCQAEGRNPHDRDLVLFTGLCHESRLRGCLFGWVVQISSFPGDDQILDALRTRMGHLAVSDDVAEAMTSASPRDASDLLDRISDLVDNEVDDNPGWEAAAMRWSPDLPERGLDPSLMTDGEDDEPTWFPQLPAWREPSTVSSDIRAFYDRLVGWYSQPRWEPDTTVAAQLILQQLGETFTELCRPTVERYAEYARLVVEQAQPAAERWAQVLEEAVPQVSAVADMLEPAEATRDVVASRVPSYRDDRPRHESPYGPRRRRGR